MAQETFRKRSTARLMGDIAKATWEHPANRGKRVGALARALRWQVRKRRSAGPVDGTFFGLRMRLHPDSNSASNLAYFGDYYDYDALHFLERYLRPGDAMLDVGANIGTYSLLAAKLVGPGGQVHAFEPVPRIAEMFRENVAANGLGDRITLHEVATSSSAGTARFIDFDVSSRFAGEGDDYIGIDVPVERVDHVVPTDTTWAFGKLDVEGAETAALTGMGRLLAEQNPPVWTIEIYPHQLAKQGSSAEELIALLHDNSYELATYDADDNALRTLSPTELADPLRGDTWAIASDRRDEVAQRVGARSSR